MRSLLAAAFLTVGLIAGAAQAAIPKALLLYADDPAWATEVRTKILAKGQVTTLDTFDASAGTPTLTQLQAYPVVFVWTNESLNDRTAFGDVLDSYVRAGGGVVMAMFALSDPDDLDIGGAWETKGNNPLTLVFQSSGTTLTLGTVHVPSSPLMAGVTSFNGGTSSYYGPGSLTSGTTSIADWSNGVPLVMTKPVGSGMVVGLNFFPPSSDSRSDFWVASTDGATLMSNALLFAAGAVRTSAVATPVPALDTGALAALALLLAMGYVATDRRRARSRHHG